MNGNILIFALLFSLNFVCQVTSQLCWKVQDKMMLDYSGKKLTGVGMEHCEFCCLKNTGCVAMNYDALHRACSMLPEDHRDGHARIYQKNMFYAYLDLCDTGYMKWLNENKWSIAGTVVGGAVAAFTAPYLIPGLLGWMGFGATGIVGGTFAAQLMALHGGNVAAGGLFAALQANGAAGLGPTGIFVSSLFGGGAGGLGGAAVAPKECTIETCPCE